MISSFVRALVSAFKAHRKLALENVALRQQLAVLRRSVKRTRLSNVDRVFWVVLRKKSIQRYAVFLFFADDSPSRESSGGWLFLEEADVDVEHGQDGDGYEADVAVEGIDLKSQEQGEREREIETDDSGGMSEDSTSQRLSRGMSRPVPDLSGRSCDILRDPCAPQ